MLDRGQKIQNHFYNSLYYFGTISQKRGHLIEGDCFIGSHNANLGLLNFLYCINAGTAITRNNKSH